MRESLTFDIAPYLMGRAPAKAQQFVRTLALLRVSTAVGHSNITHTAHIIAWSYRTHNS
jgi:hypothetical protein